MNSTRELVCGGLQGLRCAGWAPIWKRLPIVALAALVGGYVEPPAAELAVEEVPLPPLRIQGQPASAHTQGLEIVEGKYFVTARREDVVPKRALLLRTDLTARKWDVWDITPLDAQGGLTALDHPGGLQSDGTRLWIPLAESRRNGRSLLRAYRLEALTAGRSLKPELEFSVDDHIGALAVSVERGWLLGANWDTEKVYVWNLEGQLQQILTAPELRLRELGVQAGSAPRAGVAVQDWKLIGGQLCASGLYRSPGLPQALTESRVLCFTNFLEAGFQQRTMKLPLHDGLQFAQEGMAISGDEILFLPEDLGATNRMFRLSLDELAKRHVVDSPELGED
ncbi:MAG: hypothetical protein KIS67_17715 [Verrucomicrobiae bacterium]|nr:hypothetical protein [Verrucomicrobiae bacterium]